MKNANKHEMTYKEMLEYCCTHKKGYRTKAINSSLLQHLINLPYFQDICHTYKSQSPFILNSLIKNLYFVKYAPNDIICRIEDPINRVYILLSGELSILKFPPPLKESENRSSRTRSRRSSSIESRLILDSIISENGVEVDPVDYSKVKNRSVLIKSNTYSIIGEFSIKNYNLIFGKSDILEKNSILSFLEKLKIFRNKSNACFEKFMESLNKREYKKNEIIVSKGDPFSSIFIVWRGEVHLRLRVTKTFFNSFDLDYYNNNMKSSTDLNKVEKNNKSNESIEEFMRFTSSRIFELKDSYKEEKEYKIITLSPGEAFGHIEHFFKYDKYIFDYISFGEHTLLLEINMDSISEGNFNFFFNKLQIDAYYKVGIIQDRIIEIRKTRKANEIINDNKYNALVIDKINKNLDLVKDRNLINKHDKISLNKNKDFNLKYNQKYFSKIDLNLEKVKDRKLRSCIKKSNFGSALINNLKDIITPPKSVINSPSHKNMFLNNLNSLSNLFSPLKSNSTKNILQQISTSNSSRNLNLNSIKEKVNTIITSSKKNEIIDNLDESLESNLIPESEYEGIYKFESNLNKDKTEENKINNVEIGEDKNKNKKFNFRTFNKTLTNLNPLTFSNVMLKDKKIGSLAKIEINSHVETNIRKIKIRPSNTKHIHIRQMNFQPESALGNIILKFAYESSALKNQGFLRRDSYKRYDIDYQSEAKKIDFGNELKKSFFFRNSATLIKENNKRFNSAKNIFK